MLSALAFTAMAALGFAIAAIVLVNQWSQLAAHIPG
jgi:hypothetical protein